MGDMRQKGKVWNPGLKPFRVKGWGSWSCHWRLLGISSTVWLPGRQHLHGCWAMSGSNSSLLLAARAIPKLSSSRLCRVCTLGSTCPAPWLEFRPIPGDPSLIKPHFLPAHVSSHALWAQLPPLSPDKSLLHLHTDGACCGRDFFIHCTLIFPKAATWSSHPKLMRWVWTTQSGIQSPIFSVRCN